MSRPALTLMLWIASLGQSLSGCASIDSTRTVVALPTVDGIRLGGYSYGRGDRGVVLVPGAHGIGTTWDAQARRLARTGFRVLAIDYRGLGQSGGAAQDDSKTPLDVLAAVTKLKAEGVEEISVVGASWGGWAAATAALAQPGVVARIVLLAHTPPLNLQELTGRKLFIVAADDRDGSGQLRIESIRKQYELAQAPKHLHVVEGSAHAQLLFLTPQGAEVTEEIVRFLSEP